MAGHEPSCSGSGSHRQGIFEQSYEGTNYESDSEDDFIGIISHESESSDSDNEDRSSSEAQSADLGLHLEDEDDDVWTEVHPSE